jgi:ABC-2 type transport system permease protein
MYRLLFKDIKISKNYFIAGILLSAALGLLNGLLESKELLIFNLIFLFSMTYIIPTICDNIDEKYNSNYFLASLPLKRSEVVVSKYISLLLITAILFSTLFLSNLIVNFISGTSGNIISIYIFLGILILNMFIFSIYYPISYKYSYQQANMVRVVLMLSVMFLPSLITRFITVNEGKMDNIIFFIKNNLQLSLLVLLVFSLFLFVISMMVSISIYEKKDI